MVRIASHQMLGDAMANCTYDSTTGKVTSMIDVPKKKSDDIVGIVPFANLELWKKTMKDFGLTPEIAYSRDADAYLSEQFDNFKQK